MLRSSGGQFRSSRRYRTDDSGWRLQDFGLDRDRVLLAQAPVVRFEGPPAAIGLPGPGDRHTHLFEERQCAIAAATDPEQMDAERRGDRPFPGSERRRREAVREWPAEIARDEVEADAAAVAGQERPLAERRRGDAVRGARLGAWSA